MSLNNHFPTPVLFRHLLLTLLFSSGHKRRFPKLLRDSATAYLPSNSRNVFSPQPVAGDLDVETIQFADSHQALSADTTLPTSQVDRPTIHESLDVSSGPMRHSSLMVKDGYLSVVKPASGKFSARWCSLNVSRLRMFSRENQLKTSIIMGTLERVDSLYNNMKIVVPFPVVLYRKRKHRSAPVVLSASSVEEQQDWIMVISPSLNRASQPPISVCVKPFTRPIGYQGSAYVSPPPARFSSRARGALERVRLSACHYSCLSRFSR